MLGENVLQVDPVQELEMGKAVVKIALINIPAILGKIPLEGLD